MKCKIYYFSGTGNSLRAAKLIAKNIGNTAIISMENDPEMYHAKDVEMIGFVMPVYHWSLPEIVKKFIKNLEINKNAYIFAVSTPSFVNGYAFEHLEQILNKKEAKLSYAVKLYSVANLVIVYSPKPNPKKRVKKAEKNITKIVNEISQRKIKKYSKAELFVKLLYDRVMPKYKKLMPVVDVGYVINEKCTFCKICSDICPARNINFENNKPNFLHNCAMCMACICFCPKKAIGFDITKFKEINLSEKDRKIFDDPLIRKMKLPEKRLKYTNPYISVNDMKIKYEEIG